MEELRNLTLGGDAAVVRAVEVVTESTRDVDTSISEFAMQLTTAASSGAAWSKDMFRGRSGTEILQAIRVFTLNVNNQRVTAGEPMLNVLDLEQLVVRQVASLALPLQNLCRWSVLVRVGVRSLQRGLAGLVSMVPMPPKGSVKLNKPVFSAGRVDYVVAHVFGNRVYCRGYILQLTKEGEWILGGQDGNRWLKDLWLTPGLQDLDILTAARRRRFGSSAGSASRRARRAATNASKSYRKRIEARREAAGLCPAGFGAAAGPRVDLENKALMATTLASIRALLAQAIVYKEDALLDEIAGRSGHTKAELINKPSIAGREEAAFRHHMSRRYEAYRHFRPYGTFVWPRGYMVFAETSVPESIPTEAQTELSGVSGVAVSSEFLSTCPDAAALRRCPSALPEVEDLTPIMDACGVSTIHGEVVEDMELVFRDENGDEASEGAEHMRYTAVGREPAEMPLADFMRRTSVRFAPMVVDFQRHRLYVEDLQGNTNGIAWAVSFADVDRRFRPCPKPSKSSAHASNTSATKTSPSG
jgi:hypothetical protein